MINGINDNNELVNARLNGQNGIGNVVTNPISNNNPYIKEAKAHLNDISDISKEAYAIYEREQDVTKFTKIAVSDLNNIQDDIARVNELFNQGVIDPFKSFCQNPEDLISDLASSLTKDKEFLKTIEFDTL